MPRDAAATRARILAAAVEAFSRFGFAGARIDRIAAASGANKRMIYVYYKDKETLFATALDTVVRALVLEVPITEDDLPGYAGRLFDYLVAHPETLRLSLWRQLERAESSPEAAAFYTDKVRAINRVAANSLDVDTALPPTDLLVLVQGMAGAWFISPTDLLRADGSDPQQPARLASHRSALVEAVRRLAHPTVIDLPKPGDTP